MWMLRPRQLSGTRQFLLGVYNYLSDLLSYGCSINKSALYEDQRTALSFYVAAKIVLMKVLEVSICKPRHWNWNWNWNWYYKRYYFEFHKNPRLSRRGPHSQSHVILQLCGHVTNQNILFSLSQGARSTNLAEWWLEDLTQRVMCHLDHVFKWHLFSR